MTLGAATSNAFFTFAEAGVPDGTVVSYVIEDGTNVELGIGTYTTAGTTLSRTTVTASKIGGTAGTTKLTLSGSAIVYIDALAADITVPPASSTDKAIATYSGTTGRAIQDNSVTVNGNKISTTGAGLILEQTGDGGGASQLKVINDSGTGRAGAQAFNGAADYVDFGFVGSSTGDASVRYDRRAGQLIYGFAGNADEFHIGNFGTSPLHWLILGDFFSGFMAPTLQLGNVDAATPSACTLRVQSVAGGTSNTASPDTTIQGSQSTGNAAGGDIVLTTSAPGGSGSSQNAPTEAARFSSYWENLGIPKTLSKNFTVRTGYEHTVQARLTMTSTQRATLAGTANLIMTDDFGTRSRIVLAGRG
jgi:hypothetical protein